MIRIPHCITDNILKTRLVKRQNGVSDIAVTAYGFRGEPRVEMRLQMEKSTTKKKGCENKFS